MLRVHNRKAQSLTEFAMVMALVIGAVAAMQIFVGRAIRDKVWGELVTYRGNTSNYSNGAAGGIPTPGGIKTSGTSTIVETQSYDRKQWERTGGSNILTNQDKY
jgi:acyl-homoserine lactone acylase PvdQ